MSQERRFVTVVFADIVGSTAHTSTHEPELIRAVLTRAFDRFRSIVAEHGGTVEKFIGDAVMAVFGVPTLHEDDPERAIRAALSMREAVTDLNAGSALPIELRIGVNTGQVLAQAVPEGTNPAVGIVTGGPVNVAARLQQAASPGEILVGGITYQLTREAVGYEAARRVDAKGIGPVDAWPAARVRTRLPEQHRGIAGLHAPLIGRDHELNQLVEVYRRLAPDRAVQIVTLFGNAGAGKSRVTAEFLDKVRPPVVLRGRCLAYGAGSSFWPIREMLQADSGITLDDARDEALAKWRARVLAVCGEASDDANAVATVLAPLVLGTIDMQLDEQERQWALRKYVEKRAAAASVVFVFEDIHWAEAAVLDVVEGVAERARGAALLLCLARPELLESRADWGGGKRNATAIDLAPLGPDEVRQLIGGLLTVDAIPEVVKGRIADRAEGNPLYVEELIRSLMERSLIAQESGRWVARGEIRELDVPASVQGLIAARLDRLDVPLRRMLQRAALIGRVFWTDALLSLDGSGGVEERIAEAERRDLIVEAEERGLRGGRGYRFSHDLVRDVSYESIPKGERADLHDAFGRWIEEAAGERIDEYLDIVAHHAERAYVLARDAGSDAPDRATRAIDRLRRAAKRARDLDFRAALDLYERAEAVAVRSGASLDLRARTRGEVALMRARVHGREAKAAIPEAIELARLHARDELLVDLLGVLDPASEAHWSEIRAEALEVAQSTGDPELTARVLREMADWPMMFSGDLVRATALAREAEAYARANGAAKQLRAIQMDLCMHEAFQGHLSRAAELRGEIDASDSAAPTRRQQLTPLALDSFLCWLRGDLGEAQRSAREHERLAREFGSLWHLQAALQDLGVLLTETGDFGPAIDVLNEGVSVTGPESGFYPEVLWRLSRALLRAGRLEEARSRAEEAYSRALPEDLHARSGAAFALAEVRSSEGRHEEAEALYREALEVTDRTAYAHMHGWVRTSFARWLLARGQREEAKQILEGLAERQGDPLMAKRLADTTALIKQCEEVPAR